MNHETRRVLCVYTLKDVTSGPKSIYVEHLDSEPTELLFVPDSAAPK
jgi:hypothetical protein